MAIPISDKEKWYADGLRFSCTQCGNCCTGPPGYVWFTPEEHRAMAARLGVSLEEFVARYTKEIFGRLSLAETWNQEVQGYDCTFLRRDESGRAQCSIYEVRPVQCRTWPFWPSNLRSPKAWSRTAETCPGMRQGGSSGKGNFYPLEQIRIQRDATPEL